MRRRYYATFASGFQNTVKDILEKTARDAAIVLSLDGAVVFETAVPFEALCLWCFNNIFLALHVLEQKEKNSFADGGAAIPAVSSVIEAHMSVAEKSGKIRLADFQRTKKVRTFRIVTSHANRLVSVNEDLKRKMERAISRETGLIPNRSAPDVEFWFLYRNEGFSFFMRRLSKRAPFDAAPHKGELPPQLAYMLCWLSEPRKSDVILDPFCGYGSILQQRMRFPFEKFYSFDIKDDAARISKSKIDGRFLKKCDVRTVDFFTISRHLKEESVDAIITDPPWGNYEALPLPADQFYDAMLRTFYELLKPDGVIVALTARNGEFALSASRIQEFAIVEASDVLVSGRKASVYKVKKTRAGRTAERASDDEQTAGNNPKRKPPRKLL
ncbi:MAG: methyltransferase domain-containing protein [Treponema sp.]|jgi:tRNA G10  N-methylase Trm11|nr:methyltransferase domain-containing protein [Treponema sp.]